MDVKGFPGLLQRGNARRWIRPDTQDYVPIRPQKWERRVLAGTRCGFRFFSVQRKLRLSAAYGELFRV